MRPRDRMSLAMTLLLLAAAPARAEWPTDPAHNVPVDTLGDVGIPSVISDGSGGAIAVWSGNHGTPTFFAQHFDPSGQALWSSGVPMASSPTWIGYRPSVTTDGAGGAIVAWGRMADNGSGTICLQRINGNGGLEWGPDGVVACSLNSSYPLVTTDGAGGAIVVWNDIRGVVDFTQPFDRHVYVQRVSSSGVPLWTANGIPITSGHGEFGCKDIAPDCVGGAILAWWGAPHMGDGHDDVHAQRLASDGTPVWGAAGVTVCSAPGDQAYPLLAADGSGGAFIAWIDGRAGLGTQGLYAQHLDAAGTPVWAADGLGLCSLPGDQPVNHILTDGTGGAFVVWNDDRTGTWQVYAQRVNASGTGTWTANGVCLGTGAGREDSPCLASDGAGGIFLAWRDGRNADEQMYGQHLLADGTKAWSAGGLQISSAPGGQFSPDIAPEGAHGAVVIWQDLRSPTSHLYAQGLYSGGLGSGAVAGVPATSGSNVALASAGANPSRDGRTRVRFSLYGGEPASIDVLDITGRRIDSQPVGQLGAGAHEIELASLAGAAPGVYLVCLREGVRTQSTRIARLR